MPFSKPERKNITPLRRQKFTQTLIKADIELLKLPAQGGDLLTLNDNQPFSVSVLRIDADAAASRSIFFSS